MFFKSIQNQFPSVLEIPLKLPLELVALPEILLALFVIFVAFLVGHNTFIFFQI